MGVMDLAAIAPVEDQSTQEAGERGEMEQGAADIAGHPSSLEVMADSGQIADMGGVTGLLELSVQRDVEPAGDEKAIR